MLRLSWNLSGKDDQSPAWPELASHPPHRTLPGNILASAPQMLQHLPSLLPCLLDASSSGARGDFALSKPHFNYPPMAIFPVSCPFSDR